MCASSELESCAEAFLTPHKTTAKRGTSGDNVSHVEYRLTTALEHLPRNLVQGQGLRWKIAPCAADDNRCMPCLLLKAHRHSSEVDYKVLLHLALGSLSSHGYDIRRHRSGQQIRDDSLFQKWEFTCAEQIVRKKASPPVPLTK